jgi:hypothetical protein
LRFPNKKFVSISCSAVPPSFNHLNPSGDCMYRPL